MVPRSQLKLGLPVQVPWLALMAPRLKPAGKVSVRVTAVASEGPALVTVMVYVTVVEPATTVVSESVLVTARSATGAAVSVSVAWSLAVLPAVVPAGGPTVAVLTRSAVSDGRAVPVTV